MIALPSPLAVACHDAGSANLILAWLQAHPPLHVQAFVSGPAANLWRLAGLPWESAATLEAALDGAAALLSGTGWASDLEFDARTLAANRGLRSIAVLDHWVNYRQRFERQGRTVLPGEIWVVDAEAQRLAQACFPGISIVLQPNTYLQQVVRQIGPAPATGDLLYVLEPTRSDWGRQRQGEFQALDYFVQHAAVLGLAADTPVRLRLHPSEPAGKYDAWLAAQRRPVRLDTSPSLTQAMAPARWVAGCETAALAVALAAGRVAVCTLPPWAPSCRLPHAELQHLQRMVPAAA
jgi:hypothetical protein